jgi:RNA polymerase sigma-70 factor (ECF subfamily)
MSDVESNAAAAPRADGWFATTHWSVVRAAGGEDSPQATEALEKLCRTYWYPLYAHVRRHGHGPEEAQDLTQEFFARLLAKEYTARADPALGRFRSFLLACLEHFLSEQRRRGRRLKRGGGQTLISWDAMRAEERYRAEPVDSVTPDQAYDRRWALTLLEQALARLGQEQSAAGKSELFAQLTDYLWGESSGSGYAKIAKRLGLREGALKVTVHRLRRRYRELLREEVAHTTGNREEVDDELRFLIRVIRG